MKRFEIREHTADLRLFVEGDTLEELFTAALEVEGMADILTKQKPDETPSIKRKITLQSSDTTALLIDFLSDALYFSHTEGTVFRSVTFQNLTKTSFTAHIHGHKTNGFDEDIKAVTYHEAEVKKNSIGNYETSIIFDI